MPDQIRKFAAAPSTAENRWCKRAVRQRTLSAYHGAFRTVAGSAEAEQAAISYRTECTAGIPLAPSCDGPAVDRFVDFLLPGHPLGWALGLPAVFATALGAGSLAAFDGEDTAGAVVGAPPSGLI
jgi:hypothetical protein